MRIIKIAPKILALLFILTLSSCKTNRIRNNERVGRWVEYDTIDGKIYKSVGRFRDGIGKGTHRQFSDKKLVRKEKYKDEICHTIFYYENGKVMTEGDTKMAVTENLIHWYYTGDWKFYDENGRLLGIRTYENGSLMNEIEIQQ
ncbi:toxin-antitoxin system YwqK family antitoxin [Flavobacterium microcysteis]